MTSITRFVRIMAGLLPCMFLLLPNTAAAGRIEAIWDVVLHDQIDVSTNTSEQISVPAQFQIQTVFEDYVSATEEYFPDFSLTYFGIPSSTLIDRPLAPYIVPSPYGPPIDNWSRLHVGMSTADDSSSFFENFNIELYNLSENDKGRWAHGMYISVTLESPVRNGDGTSDFHHTPDQLWDFLNEFKETPSNYYVFLMNTSPFGRPVARPLPEASSGRAASDLPASSVLVPVKYPSQPLLRCSQSAF